MLFGLEGFTPILEGVTHNQKKLLFPSIPFYFGPSIRNGSWLEGKSACGKLDCKV